MTGEGNKSAGSTQSTTSSGQTTGTTGSDWSGNQDPKFQDLPELGDMEKKQQKQREEDEKKKKKN